MRYEGAISDTDILINLACVDKIQILEYLFKRIIIPWYVYEVEIKKVAGRYFSRINHYIKKEGSIFQIKDRKKDKSINLLAKDIISDKKSVIGPGESECAGYARAFRIPIILSDNYTEFKWLSEYITLTHRNILSLCVYFNKISKQEGSKIFNDINSNLSRPTKWDFDYFYNRSLSRFKDHGWDRYLGIIEEDKK